MPSLLELVRAHTDLDDDDVTRLQQLMADWQIIADLSFADLVMWLPDREGNGFWAGGQMRPTTGPTSLPDDVVGTFVPTGRRRMVDEAYEHGRPVREGDPEWRDDVPVRVEAIPVRRAGRIIAVVARNTNLLGVRTPSRPELSYLQTAAELTQMIAGGWFPPVGQRSDHADTARVGDGFLRPDAGGRVAYASPNALSVYRRLGLHGDLTNLVLTDLTRDWCRRGGGSTRSRSVPCSAAALTTTPRSRPTTSPSWCAASRCDRTASASARSSCCATSPSCDDGTASSSPRTPPSARSITG
ncbi:histidine kinase N-terminal domain-containing protein [Nocardioides sp. B-3]|uniref:histidine kinase N-terminal domain-containing protein n=1 Tax=Nocardioides sp. B-3 TaxID=2895565 RepID=UPI0021538C9E|nr:histidine kinase N-terminal domain-containing protein [Nocardioides sp. B-3]UUZ58318.1 histidine kinase N-terminal domain-containing protein [Nocardioides sp. B-3]